MRLTTECPSGQQKEAFICQLPPSPSSIGGRVASRDISELYFQAVCSNYSCIGHGSTKLFLSQSSEFQLYFFLLHGNDIHLLLMGCKAKNKNDQVIVVDLVSGIHTIHSDENPTILITRIDSKVEGMESTNLSSESNIRVNLFPNLLLTKFSSFQLKD